MPGFVIHIAIAKEYIKKHNDIDNIEEFIKGNIEPDLTKDKAKTHYGKSPTYTNLKEFLLHNKLDNDINKGKFLHLITDYLFYNLYLKDVPVKGTKEILHNDYDIINEELISKYNIKLLEEIKHNVYYKEGKPNILTLDIATKVINEISDLDINQVKEGVLKDHKKWNSYKNI